jgi:transcriptional regulator with XRE-family HTH domain
MTHVKHYRYTLRMPRVPKQILPPLKLSSESVGQRIARIRKLRGLTQVQLAERIGIERTVIANYEKDRLRIYDEMLARIAIALSVSTDELLGLAASTPTKDEAASLRLVRRLRKIEQLPPAKQKAIIQTLDMALQSFDQDRSE